jgi:aspartate 1-decarboxylase
VNSERSLEAVFSQLCQQVEFMLYKIDIRLPEILFISGQLASGKRTQTKMIQEKYGYDVIVTNEVLREAVKNADEVIIVLFFMFLLN